MTTCRPRVGDVVVYIDMHVRQQGYAGDDMVSFDVGSMGCVVDLKSFERGGWHGLITMLLVPDGRLVWMIEYVPRDGEHLARWRVQT